MAEAPSGSMLSLAGAERDRVLPVLYASFEGIYRWHAKRTLRDVPLTRALVEGSDVVAFSLLDRPAPEVGYVYYLAVAPERRHRGIAGRMLDDALIQFGSWGVEVAYGAAEEDNHASLSVFRSRGFRSVEPKELGWKDGGLGAWGLRSRMRIVSGEQLLGRRLRPRPGVATLDEMGST